MKSEVMVAIPITVGEGGPRSGGCRAVLAWLVLVFLCVLWAPASRASLIWNSDLGTQLPDSGFTFDSSPTDPTLGGLQSETLDFSVPFDGSSYSAVNIATSGFLWLGTLTNGAQCCDEGGTDMLDLFQNGPPRIAAGWYDLRPDLGGAIYFNDIYNPSGTSEAVITYVNVPSNANGTDTATFQMQLFSTGVIIFSYMQFNPTSLGPDLGALIGVTSGEGAPDAATDLSSVLAAQIYSTCSPGPTCVGGVYDYFQPGDNLTLTGQSIIFTPQGANGFQVAIQGAPEPATFLPAAAFFFLLAANRLRRKRRFTEY